VGVSATVGVGVGVGFIPVSNKPVTLRMATTTTAIKVMSVIATSAILMG